MHAARYHFTILATPFVTSDSGSRWEFGVSVGYYKSELLHHSGLTFALPVVSRQETLSTRVVIHVCLHLIHQPASAHPSTHKKKVNAHTASYTLYIAIEETGSGPVRMCCFSGICGLARARSHVLPFGTPGYNIITNTKTKLLHQTTHAPVRMWEHQIYTSLRACADCATHAHVHISYINCVSSSKNNAVPVHRVHL